MLRSIAQGALAGLREAALPLPAACRLQGPAVSCTSVLSRCYTAEPAHERKLSRASSESKFGAITIGQVMKEKAESGDPRASLFWCQPQDKAFEAIKKMAEANVGSILVMKSSDPHRYAVPALSPTLLCKRCLQLNTSRTRMRSHAMSAHAWAWRKTHCCTK